MELLNRVTIKEKYGTGKSRSRKHISISDKCMYFTAQVVKDCGIRPGEFMHFLNEGDKWRFYTNDDSEGFLITPVVSKGGCHITHSVLCSRILKTTGFKNSKRFDVKETGQEQDKCKVYEIIPAKVIS